MFIYKNGHSILFKTIAIVSACLFLVDDVALSIDLKNPHATSTLAPLSGNPEVYQEMRSMMEGRLAAHQEPIDEFIKQRANKAKNLSSIPYLEEEFIGLINACNANNMLARLKTTLASAGGRIQVIFVKNENELPIFEGKKILGHSGAYITVLALESEKDSKEGRRKIIARLFHEIRARSTRAKELFDEELKNKNPTTSEEISAFIRSTRERFEKDNLQMQQEIERNSLITSPALVREFTDLTFAMHPDIMNRDYMMTKDVSPERPRKSVSGTPASADELDWKIICKMSRTIICELAYEKAQHNLEKAARLIDIDRYSVEHNKNRSYSNPFYETAKAALVKILSPLVYDKNHSGEIYKKAMHTVRRSLALLALEKASGNKAAAARLLRMPSNNIRLSLWVETLPEPYESQVRQFLAESAIPVLLQQLEQPLRERKQVQKQKTVVIEQLNYHEIVKMARAAVCELAYEDKQSRFEDAAKALGISSVHVRRILIKYRYVHTHPLYHTMKKSLGSALSPLLENKPPLPSLYGLTINTIQRSLVILAMEYTHDNLSAASRLLQLNNKTIRDIAGFKLLPEPYLGQVKKFVAEEIFPALVKEYNNPLPRPKRHFAAMPSIAEKPSDIELYTWQGLVRLATSAMSHVVYEDMAGKNMIKAASLIGCAETNLRYYLSYDSDSFLFNALRAQLGDIVNRLAGRKRFLFDIRWAIRRVCAEAALTIADDKQGNAARLLKTNALVINKAMQKKQNNEIYRLLKNAIGSTISFAILRKNIVEKVIGIADNELRQKDDIELQQLAQQLKKEAGKGVAQDKTLPYAFALFYEVARRTAGLEPAREQVMAALALHYGFAVEMLPSEGKTLAIAMAAYLNALYARGVHIHTFNDFLARRDCQDMGRIFAFLGMTTATLVGYSASYQYQQMPYRSAKIYTDTPNLIPAKKDKAYQCDITYGPRDEFIFDFLRDNMVLSPEHRVQRTAAPGLIIVDEADNCMIDEAYNPMIVGKLGIGIGRKSYKKIYDIAASRLAQQNEKNRYYAVDYLNQLILINPDAGTDEVFDAMLKDSLHTNLFWRNMPKKERLNLLTSALSAIHFYHKDEDYVVRDGRIIIVDEFTGRLKPLQMWANHITQFVQAREGLNICPPLAPVGIITYQNYYRIMKERTRLAVTSGTIGTTAEEFRNVYDLATMCIPLQWSSLRIDRQPEMLPDDKKQAARIIERIKEIHQKGSPVLVFTPTIKNAHNLRGLLQQSAGINAATLDGIDTSEEFSIIAHAGKKGGVTIATNTAGRGVHIRTYDEVDSLGGLCVILTTQNRDGRIDEQQRTRTARRGRKGWTETILSLEDNFYKRFGEKDPQLASEEFYRAMRQKTFDLDILLDKKRREFYAIREYLLQSAIDQTRKVESLNLMDSEWSRFLTKLERIRYIATHEEYRQLCETGFSAVKMKIWEMVPETRIGALLNVKETLEEVRKILPKELYENDFKSAEFFAELSRLLQIENILDQDKSTLIFSEKVTFDNGLGALLPKLAKSGTVAVIAANDRQRALIDELNQGKPENERIIYADTVADVRTKVHTARYYYFKVNGDPDTDLQGITTFDITEIVKKIIDALGKVSGITERERLELLHQAAQKFAQAA